MARKMLVDGELGQTIDEEKQYDFDLFVIGAGSGGVRASRTSAAFGAKVRDYDSFASLYIFFLAKIFCVLYVDVSLKRFWFMVHSLEVNLRYDLGRIFELL
ncbi:hypothetical protein BHE74_00006344 [Ensete ventricosum]|uniref:Uncharacterized protein n=1 Tax=Ensete ventricosum TaxID=4639 RepID=A0A444DXX1_ENSVE|nr:hypothetical protein B296_00022867 [Ensete ventricosum]RWW02977.1 hypothetical protein GW17_00033904 [Ensete ventricosum]RWW85014.1 hypothetical protein BHE74_00006344 [Ensete ventricosum]RZR84629.1 hypothetical protein BHM03_00011484 [Ensete ventricosum]